MDLFHENVSVPSILRVFNAMQRAPWHTYQVLTKRSERLQKLDRLLADALVVVVNDISRRTLLLSFRFPAS
ncbi:MAG: DUF5131 family protein [Phycisphaerae bacterium]|nr:DUF5131 family protein [Phycisphaerae bacterium]